MCHLTCASGTLVLSFIGKPAPLSEITIFLFLLVMLFIRLTPSVIHWVTLSLSNSYVLFYHLTFFFICFSCFPTENPSMMKNTQNPNSEYSSHRKINCLWMWFLCNASHVSRCNRLIVTFPEGLCATREQNVTPLSAQSKKCARKSGTDQRGKFLSRPRFQLSKYWQVDVFSFCPECIFPDRTARERFSQD